MAKLDKETNFRIDKEALIDLLTKELNRTNLSYDLKEVPAYTDPDTVNTMNLFIERVRAFTKNKSIYRNDLLSILDEMKEKDYDKINSVYQDPDHFFYKIAFHGAIRTMKLIIYWMKGKKYYNLKNNKYKNVNIEE